MPEFKIGDKVIVKQPNTNGASPTKDGRKAMPNNVNAVVVPLEKWMTPTHVCVKIDGDTSAHGNRCGWYYPPENLIAATASNLAMKIGRRVIIKDAYQLGANPRFEGGMPAAIYGRVASCDPGHTARVVIEGDVSNAKSCGWFYREDNLTIVKAKKKSGRTPPRYVSIVRNSTGQIIEVRTPGSWIPFDGSDKHLTVQTVPEKTAGRDNGKYYVSVKTLREIADKMDIKLVFKPCTCSDCK